MMKMYRDFVTIVDSHTWLIVILALLTTYLCRQFDYIADLPASLIGIAVIFPLVFSINSAYRRREEALRSFASLKAHAVSLYLAHRDWADGGMAHEIRGGVLIERLLTAVNDHFANGERDGQESMSELFDIFSDFSTSHELLRQAGVPANEISRANQYLRALMIEFEQMNNIAHYRTPVALRAYSRLFLNLFPILFGPYFANVAYPEHPFLGYMVAALYAMVLASLDNIQDHLENPFDGVGPDDLRLNIAEHYAKLMQTADKSFS
jgi:hypothetical protein